MVVGLLVCLSTVYAESPWKPPDVLIFVSTDISTSHFQASTALGSTISESTGGKVKIRVQPEGKGFARVELLRTKKVNFVCDIAATSYDAAHGLEEFNRDGWGPQRLRALWFLAQNPMGYVTTKASGIKTLADIKGKRVARYLSYPGLDNYGFKSMLAFANLGWDEVKQVNVGGYKEGVRALQDGAVDVCILSLVTPTAREIEASPRGIHWLPVPRSNADGWARFKKVSPMMYPMKEYSGPGVSKDEPLETFGYVYRWNSYNWMDENLAYWFCKQMKELYPTYKDKFPLLKLWILDSAVNLEQAFSPFHPGAVRYFKEIGKWGPKEDQWQAEALAREQATIKEWKEKHPQWKME